jgi:hypothetical protein
MTAGPNVGFSHAALPAHMWNVGQHATPAVAPKTGEMRRSERFQEAG